MNEIIGYIVSAILATIMFFVERTIHKNKNTTPALRALTVLLLGVILTVVFSLRYEVAVKNEEQLEKLSIIQSGTQLAENLLRAELSVKHSTDQQFESIFDSRKKEFLLILENATNGIYVVRKEEVRLYSIDLISSAKKSILATSYVSTNKWWEDKPGKDYLKLNYDLVKRGVKIRRYFICSSDTEAEYNRSLIIDQANNGIEVYIVFTRDLDFPYTKDLIILDDRIGGRLDLTVERDIEQATMYVTKDRIEDIRKIFNNLSVKSRAATEYFSSR